MAFGKWIGNLKATDVDALMNMDIEKAKEDWQWMKK